MRRLLSTVTVSAGVCAVLAVPVVARPGVEPHAVAPRVTTVAFGRADHPHPGGVLAEVSRRHTARFELVGATWRRGTLEPGSTRVQVRVRHDGRWSTWNDLAPQDGGADGGSADARRAARVHPGLQSAEPVWVGDSDGVEARVVGAQGRAATMPTALHVVLVDGGRSAADAHVSQAPVFAGAVADAAVAQPQIYTRADWGANEALRRDACPGGPDYSPTVEMGFVHHTDNANGYTRSQVPGIIRSIYAYHVRSNGWCDVGYNFLVDRFGRIWEGRYGGIRKAVIGAHTGGFNYDSFAASLIGNFASVHPSSAMQAAVARLFAWKLGLYYRDPVGKATLTAASFSGSRYPTGSDVTFKVVSGHRDADFTDCPGNAAYGDLPELRTAVRQAFGAGFVSPSVDRSRAPMGAGEIDVDARVVGAQTWSLAVADGTDHVVRTITGSASRSAPVHATWDLTADAGTPVLPGTYRLTLTGADAAGHAARPWTRTVTVDPPLTLSVPRQTTLHALVRPHGTGIRGHSVAVEVTGPTGTTQLGSFPVDSSGRWTAATTEATADLTWTARDLAVPAYSRTRASKVGPAITAPVDTQTLVARGRSVAVQGTALPGTGHPVTLMTQVGTSPATPAASVPVAPDGSWSASFVPVKPTTFWVADSRGLRTVTRQAYPIDATTATAPTSGYAGRQVVVRGNAGGGPAPVTLARRDGGSWTTVGTVTAGGDGRFRLRLALPDAAGTSARWRISTGYATPVVGDVDVLPVFAPTVTGPARVAWDSRRTLSGVAVPGDVLTVWTRPVRSSTWTARGTVRAAADKTWSWDLTFRRDVDWRVTSASGPSGTGTTRIVPTIHAPRASSPGALVVVRGRAIPGVTLILRKQPPGASGWTEVRRITVPADGSWAVRRHPQSTVRFAAVAHRQISRTIQVTVG